MDYILTHRTNEHNFWKTNSPGQELYNITKRGEPMPTGGWWYPKHILMLKGYKDLSVDEVFQMEGRAYMTM
tara:strand:+ start:1443 stop:1655 length:213 start_codon:yes stop_codon:yes gene_type:complete